MNRLPQEEPSADSDVPGHSEAAFNHLAALLRAGAHRSSAATEDEQRRRFARNWRRLHSPLALTRVRWLVPVLSTACVLVFFALQYLSPERTHLRVVASTTAGSSAGASVGAMLPEQTVLRFSEGTVAHVGENSRALISQLNDHGAAMVLIEGRLSLEVKKRANAAWRVEAGPYVVEVTGTAFDVHWNEQTQRFRVDLETGSVKVSGPGLADRTPLQAGHTLAVEHGAAQITELAMVAAADVRPATRPGVAPNPAPPGQPTIMHPRPRKSRGTGAQPSVPQSAVESPAVEPALQPAAPAVEAALADLEPTARVEPERQSPARAVIPAPLPSLPAARPSTQLAWEQRLVAGDHAALVDEAQRLGLENVLNTKAAHDLKALADAGLYSGQVQVSQRALMALRNRFSGSALAQTAAFELGRLQDDHRHQTAEALRWYGLYLEESPHGPLAEEALGRLMLAHSRLGNVSQAQAAAKRYLQVYPSGARQQLAKRVLRSSP